MPLPSSDAVSCSNKPCANDAYHRVPVADHRELLLAMQQRVLPQHAPGANTPGMYIPSKMTRRDEPDNHYHQAQFPYEASTKAVSYQAHGEAHSIAVSLNAVPWPYFSIRFVIMAIDVSARSTTSEQT